MSHHNVTKIPFYRNAKVLPILLQTAVLLAVVLSALLLLLNFKRGLEAQNLDTSFTFLGQAAGFRIAEGLEFSPEDTYFKAFLVGLYNTFRATVLGILLASLLGLVAGTARLANNWLVNRLAYGYVEIVRSTPLLVQLIFWYFAVVLQLPNVREAFKIGPTIFLSQRGLAVPSLQAPPLFWGLCFSGIAIAVFVWRGVLRWQHMTGKNFAAPWVAVATLAVFVSAATFGLKIPLAFSIPELGTFRIQGGVTLSPEFTALLAALVFYFGAFIAEVIRGGIISVPKGQWEAARALGLSYLETLRIIILPQALKIIVPPLGNIYLNLAKASSLAIAIGYPDLFGVSATMGSQSGHSVQVMLMVLVTYLALTLLLAGGINWANRSVQVKTR